MNPEDPKPEENVNDNTQIPSSGNTQNNRNQVSIFQFSDSRSENGSIIEHDARNKDDDEEMDFPSINKGILDLYFPVVQEIFLSDKDKERSPNCAICFEELFKRTQDKKEKKAKVRRIIMCGHLFHDKCMQTWFKEEEVCPLCKTYLDYFAIRKHEVANHLKCQELRSKCHSVTYVKDDDNRTVKIDESGSKNSHELKTIKFDSCTNLDVISPIRSLEKGEKNRRKTSNPKSCIGIQNNEEEEESKNVKKRKIEQ